MTEADAACQQGYTRGRERGQAEYKIVADAWEALARELTKHLPKGIYDYQVAPDEIRTLVELGEID